jgi:UDP-2,3-diacylglucosamine pyrophosphatase LpxH
MLLHYTATNEMAVIKLRSKIYVTGTATERNMKNDNDNDAKNEVQDICHRHSHRAEYENAETNARTTSHSQAKTYPLFKIHFIKLLGICEVLPPLYHF